MKREFLMLAHDFESGKFPIGGWFCSDKLDGIRCFWDSGVSRGLPCSQVPWANITKHGRFVDQKIATGLWTRYGQPIFAPDWWLNSLPVNMTLDGELTMGVGTWQETSSTVKQHNPDERWEHVRYACFDSPPLHIVMADGTINNSNFKKTFKGIDSWLGERRLRREELAFYKVNFHMKSLCLGTYHYWLEQRELPLGFTASEDAIKHQLAKVESIGGEGLIIRSGLSLWKPERSHLMLKVKSCKDAEGTVVGYKAGKPTDIERCVSGESTNKMLGLMGSLRVQMDNGIEFDLSGFTEAERRFTEDTDAIKAYLVSHPGELVPEWIKHPLFPIGSKVTFKYRELSKEGLPKEARYWRKDER